MAQQRGGETSPNGDELVFLALGGLGEIGMNGYLYGFGPEDARKWLMVDLGITFPSEIEPGIDVILPDLRLSSRNIARLVGIVLTHAHEDHIGAVIELWPQLKAPIYATPFTAGMVQVEAGRVRWQDQAADHRSAARRTLPGRAIRYRDGDAGALDSGAVRHRHPHPAGPRVPHRRLEDRRDAARRPPAGRGEACGAGRGGRAGNRLQFDERVSRGPLAVRDGGRTLDRRYHQGRQAPRGGHDVRLERRACQSGGRRGACERARVGGRGPGAAQGHQRRQGNRLLAGAFPLSRPGPIFLSRA